MVITAHIILHMIESNCICSFFKTIKKNRKIIEYAPSNMSMIFTFFLPVTVSLLYFNYLIDIEFRVLRSSSHSDNNQPTWRSASSIVPEYHHRSLSSKFRVNYGKINRLFDVNSMDYNIPSFPSSVIDHLHGL